MKFFLLAGLLTCGVFSVEGQTIAQTNAYTNLSTTNVVTFTLTSLPAQGSLLLAFTNISQTGGTRSITAPDSFWIKLDEVTSSLVTLTVWERIVRVGDGSTYSFSISTGSPTANDYASGEIININNASAAAPINQHTIHASTGSTFTPTPATPTVLGTLPILVHADTGGANGGNTATSPAGWTQFASARSFWHESYGYTGPITTDTTTAIGPTGTTNTSIAGVNALVLVAPGINGSGCATVQEGQSCTVTYNRTVNLAAAGSGSLSCTTGCTSATFFAASNIAGKGIVRAGCPVFPADSIYSTRIDALPVYSKSAAWNTRLWATYPQNYWIWNGSGSGWGVTTVDNSTPTTNYTFFFSGAAPNPFPDPPTQVTRRENGGFATGDFSVDTHEVLVNRETCDINEEYGQGPSGTKREAGSRWNATGSKPYSLSNGASGSVAGMPYLPLLLNADDVKYGVNHPLDFAFLSVVPTTGGRFNSTDFTNGYSWPAQFSNLTTTAGYSNPPTGSLPGLGSWARLSNAWCTANLGTYSGYVLNILTGLCHYGMILTDWTTGGGFGGHIDPAVYSDPAVIAAMQTASNVVGTAWSGGNNIEWVDVSSLSTCSTWWNCNSAQINPANGFVTPTVFATITATDAGGDTPQVINVGLVPVTIGTLHPALIIPAGSMASYQLTWYVNGTTNQAVNWTGTNVSSTGLFTVPGTESAITQFDLIGSSAVDSNAKVYVSVYVIPSNADGSIRLDNGSSTPVFTDVAGEKWMSDKFLPQLVINPFYDTSFSNQNWPTGIADRTIWLTATSTASGSSDLVFGDFVLPPGNYQVTWMSNADSDQTKPVTQKLVDQSGNNLINSSGDFGPVILSANQDIEGLIRFGLIHPANPFLTVADQRITLPAVVSADKMLQIRMHTTIQHKANGTCCIGGRHFPVVQGIYIEPYTGTAQWKIEASQITSVNPGQTVQCFLQDWGTGAGSTIQYDNNFLINLSSDRSKLAVWSVLGGGVGGTINPVSGLYTAPATLAVSGYDTIQVQDATIGKSATYKMWVNGTAHPTFGSR